MERIDLNAFKSCSPVRTPSSQFLGSLICDHVAQGAFTYKIKTLHIYLAAVLDNGIVDGVSFELSGQVAFSLALALGNTGELCIGERYR